MISPAEQKDLDEMKAAQAKARESAFNMCRMLLGMTQEQLGHCGFKTVEQGIVSTVKHSLAESDKLAKAFLKKWPD